MNSHPGTNGLVLGPWLGISPTYLSLSPNTYSGNGYGLLFSNNSTYVSSNSGGTTFLRGPNNSQTLQIALGTTVAITGNTSLTGTLSVSGAQTNSGVLTVNNASYIKPPSGSGLFVQTPQNNGAVFITTNSVSSPFIIRPIANNLQQSQNDFYFNDDTNRWFVEGLFQAQSLTVSGLIASRVLVTNSSANIISSPITTAQLGTLSGISTATNVTIQTQLNGKLSLAGGTMTGQLNLADNVALNLGVNGFIDLDGGGYINFSNDDRLSYDDTSNTYLFGSDGGADNGDISCGDIFSLDISAFEVSTTYTELVDTFCRPTDDNDTNLGSSSRRWIRVYAVNGTINTSDERLKLDVTDSPLGLDFINDLRPVSYRWKVGEKKALTDEDGKLILDENGNKTYEIREGIRKHYGLISQEVKQAVDNSGVDDFAGWVQDDMSDPDSHQSLSYEQFIAPLIKSVQELSAEVELLKNKISSIEKQ
jgi:hypothetical protein